MGRIRRGAIGFTIMACMLLLGFSLGATADDKKGKKLDQFWTSPEAAHIRLRSVALLGPLTVPQIAQMRPTSRQRMQRLADELAADGLVEFVDNPRHRRSKLVRMTSRGDARYREWSARFLAIASTMGADVSEADIRKTTEIVRRLSDETKGRSERLPRSIRLAASGKGDQ